MIRLLNIILLLAATFFVSCEPNSKSSDISLELDELNYNADSLDLMTKTSYEKLMESEYRKEDLLMYMATMEVMIQKDYFLSAKALSRKVDVGVHTPQELSVMFEFLGYIAIAEKNSQEAIGYFEYAFVKYPVFPEYKGYNRLKFYDKVLISYLVEHNCNAAQAYYDSLKFWVYEYPDSLFYIGGMSRLDQIEEQLELICD